jgi:hypothetical protein
MQIPPERARAVGSPLEALDARLGLRLGRLALPAPEPPLDGLGDKVRSIFWGLALRSGPQNGIDPGQRALYETRPKRRRKAPLILSWGTPLRFVLSLGRTTPSGRVDQMTFCIGRREFITLLGGLAWPLAARAQQPERMRRIGVLMNTGADEPESQARLAAFMQGLQELGWAVGRNMRIDYRWSAGDAARMRKDATELVALSPEVILAGVGATTPMLKQATRTVPIVMAQGIDPVGASYVESLARPGGNILGLSSSNTAWPENGWNCSRRSRRESCASPF